jgi:predicted nucleotidyltransferase
MSTALLGSVLYWLDMVVVRSGEILTLYGNFDGPWYRVRLSFYPNKESTRLVEGRPYTKVTYETGYYIPGCQKVLDLPGEQHFEIHQSQIVKVYRALKAFDGLSRENLRQCLDLIDFLFVNCNLEKTRNGLTGSGALHGISPTSDFDWVIYERDPARVKSCIVSSDHFKRELTFTMAHVYRKYQFLVGLNQKRLDALFTERWKYVRYQNLALSFSFVDPSARADGFFRPDYTGDQIIVRATVTDCAGCYHSPRIIPVVSSRGEHKVLTWLFLYSGAFKDGDTIEVSGRVCRYSEVEYILVESPTDYIRNLTVEAKG